MIGRAQKQELKAAIIDAVHGKMPMKMMNGYSVESATIHTSGESFLNLKVRGPQGNIECYFEVAVKERW